ncbi:MAG: methyltransferase [Verrucomicrobiales bacterium]
MTSRAANALAPRFAGVAQVVRFNWPFYAIAALTISVGSLAAALAWPWFPVWAKLSSVAGLAAVAWWTLASLVASHWIYDRSDWPRGCWIARALGDSPVRRLLNVHAGFDETTLHLRVWLPETDVVALDLFDPVLMTERSIHRARLAGAPVPATLKASFNEWPCQPHSFDVVCFLLAAHEFRDRPQRRTLFSRAREALAVSPASCVLLVEHLRDAANFAAFGPGFLHFQAASTWHRDWQAAGLVEVDSFSITPFLRLWKLKPEGTYPMTFRQQ